MSLRQVVKLQPVAIQRNKDQADYYRLKSGPALAARWRKAVSDAVKSLRVMPERGTPCNFVLRQLRDLRWIPIKEFPKHMLVYKVDRSTNEIFVVSILHGAQDLEQELSMDLSQS